MLVPYIPAISLALVVRAHDLFPSRGGRKRFARGLGSQADTRLQHLRGGFEGDILIFNNRLAEILELPESRRRGREPDENREAAEQRSGTRSVARRAVAAVL